MVIKVVILLVIIFCYISYLLYFKQYLQVKKVFISLKNFLTVRDSLILKLIPDIKDKEICGKIVVLIEERKLNFDSSYNNAIKSDVKLNSNLKHFYESIDKIKDNEVIREIFIKIMRIEKDLKNIRKRYNQAVEKYNNNLIKYKFVCLKLIRMKPLDTYNILK